MDCATGAAIGAVAAGLTKRHSGMVMTIDTASTAHAGRPAVCATIAPEIHAVAPRGFQRLANGIKAAGRTIPLNAVSASKSAPRITPMAIRAATARLRLQRTDKLWGDVAYRA